MAYYPASKAKVYRTDPLDVTPSVAMTNEACTANSARTAYTITNDAKTVIDDTSAVTVETSPNGSDWSAATGIDRIVYAAGTVVFASAKAVGTQVRISGKYIPYVEFSDCTGYAINQTVDVVETTPIGVTAKTKYPVVKDATVTIDRFHTDSSMETITNKRVVLLLYIDTTGNTRYQAFGTVKTAALKAEKASLLTESISFEVDGELYKITG